ncbi:peptidase M13 family protein [Rhodopirellula maiorica SM1]|uniref:Peptidase M13 family protein n=1 Tax=Rhodopirellula maiorica SM1 TaxID=1265738 RepID=M5RF43_9BACT|nr:peptidase M13 family protein [Rhodopirellula maiorica SM1]
MISATLHAQQTVSAATSAVSGIDKSLFSESVSPGENFYKYANQKWLETTQIPGDKSDYGIFTILNDQTREQVRELIEASAAKKSRKGSAAQKIGDLYRSVTDMQSRNEAGISPIEPLVATIDAATSKADLAKVLGTLSRNGVYGPFATFVGVDAKKSDQYTVYVTQAGLTLPDRDYYLEDVPRYVELREQLKVYIRDLLSQFGSVSDADVESVYKIEHAIAQSQWSKTENRDPDKTYNATTATELAKQFGRFNWEAYAKATGLQDQDKYVVRQPSYIDAFATQFADTDLSAWKAYLRFHVLDAYASELTESLEQRHFDFHSTAISGITEQEPLWKRAVNTTSGVLGELVGQVYVERHFKPEAKERMNELVENLKQAFAKRIQTRDWMSEGTKKQAIEKLGLFTTKIGYPDEWKDYSKLSIDPDSLASNIIASANFEHQRDLQKLGGPIDRNEWHMTPQTINAYYNPTMNEIVFPAAILQPPFFNMAADDAVNYGAIGAVIGHELSHGFDDKGSKYDGHGNLRMWWTPSDREEFERRAAILSKQYSDFEPVEGNFVNGDLTLGENIGDLGGLSLAYEAYQISLDGKEAPVIDGLTGDQRFFLGWSQIWRRLYREQELLKRLITDPHSPSEYRVNGIVRNMDAWYKAFDVKPNDPLYLPPDERVRIW